MLAEAIRPIGAALDPERIRRAAEDIQPPDTQQLVRTLHSVPDRLDEVLGDAGQAIRDALQQLPERLPDQVIDRLPEPVADRLPIEQRRGPGKAQLAFLVGGLVAIGVAGWLAFRLRTQAALRAEEARLEQAALDRAADEGMDGTVRVLGAEGVAPVPVPIDRAVAGDAGPAGFTDRAWGDVVTQPAVGTGPAADR